MNCDRARQLLHPYLDRELAAPARRGVEDHLHTCVACAAESARLEEVVAAVKAGGRNPLPPTLLSLGPCHAGGGRPDESDEAVLVVAVAARAAPRRGGVRVLDRADVLCRLVGA